MKDWQPIGTIPLNQTVLFYQPDYLERGTRLRDEGMMVGSVKERPTLNHPYWSIQPDLISGGEVEVELTHPTHWLLLPEPPK